MPPTRIIIDTDPGVDDALTFLLALASPEIQLEALTTTHGNIGIEKTTRNALAVLEFAKASHIPVARGCSLPLVSPLQQIRRYCPRHKRDWQCRFARTEVQACGAARD